MPIFDTSEIAQCRTTLERIADLSAYTTGDAVDDLDGARAALGYNEINVFGTSYGTRVALR
jgi:pimeloyl-ACP methyl ester carboxylesterase